MFASVVTGQYCSVHRLLFISSLQEWLPFSPMHIAHAFGDAMQVIEAPCPRCVTTAQRSRPSITLVSALRVEQAASPTPPWPIAA
jgi:hypothetical protein